MTEHESTFKSWDGCELFYRAWNAEGGSKRAVLLLHRGHEHSGRVARTFEELNLSGCAGFAFDMRGHGRSPGERGYAEGYDVWVKDLNAFVNHLRDAHGVNPTELAVVANSVGAMNAVTWVHDYGVQVRCLALAAPAFRIRLYVPLAIPMLRLLFRIKPRAFITSYVRSGMLTHDKAEAAAYDADPLITRNIAVSVLLGMHDAAGRILADAGAITTPTLVLSAGSDYVVENRAHGRFFTSISSARREQVIYPGAYHALLYDTCRGPALAKIREFVLACFADGAGPDLVKADLVKADREGYTHREYQRLQAPAARLPRLAFGAQVAVMKTVGRLSRGILTGLRTGFNSGASLDHVYRDCAEGRTVFGRLIDRVYLNAIGWRGIRLRKRSLQAWVRSAVARLEGEGREARIMDVASGPGRYLLELKRENPRLQMLLCDRDPANLDAVRMLAGDWQLEGVRCLQVDTFACGAYGAIGFRPNIAIVSGLYELIPDNGAVLASLRNIAEALEPGGYLVYTGQPWHPQLEMIARTLTGSDGKAWIMRRRTQAELNALTGAAGFSRVDSSMDAYGIFTVTLARKGAV